MFLLNCVAAKIENARLKGFELSDARRVEITSASKRLGKMVALGDTAVIPVEGVLSEKFDIIEALFGGGSTTYPDIIASIAAANSDPAIKRITLDVGYSPGGYQIGMFDAMRAIAGSQKPVTAIVKHGAMSAAYGLVSQAGKVVAASDTTEFGSVGVATDIYVEGDVVTITNTDSPDKRPDVTTDAGQEKIRERLDKSYQLFGGMIAEGRGLSLAELNEKFGKGSTMFAREAKRMGMIDKIGITTAARGKKEKKAMTLDELKAQFPAVFKAAFDEGVMNERDRVTSHVIMGRESGAVDVALDAIENGTNMTASLDARYKSAAFKASARQSLVDDNPPEVAAKSEPQLTSKQKFERDVLAALDGKDDCYV